MKDTRFLILIVYMCSACTSIYLPTSRNTPLFSNQGEFQANASVGNGFNVQTAYALTDHFALMVNGLYANNKSLQGTGYRKHYATEAGVGYFLNGKYTFEVFGGYGVGKGYGQDSISSWFSVTTIEEQASGKYQKFFLQPTIGRNVNNFQFAFTSRLSFIDFAEMELLTEGIPRPTGIQELFFLEPSFTVRYFTSKKKNPVFVFTQFGTNIPLHHADQVSFNYSLMNYSVGVGVALKRMINHP